MLKHYYHHYSLIHLVAFLALTALTASTPACSKAEAPHCGWELMQDKHIPIAVLGAVYADQTGDRSLCSVTEKGLSYCTCVFECGNGVWRCAGKGKEEGWRFEKGCRKYCHEGECDADGA